MRQNQVSVPPIKEYLSQLYSNPDELMTVMSLTSTYISGSRAAGYFYPWAVGDSSDWDMYCVGSSVQRRAFRMWMDTVGFDITSRNDTYGDGTVSRVVTGKLCNGNGVHNKVQIISPTKFDIISTVLDFNHTLPMCYISGSHAASLYHVFSSLKMSWVKGMHGDESGRVSSYYISSDMEFSNIAAMIVKYTGRGVEFYTKCPLGTYPVNEAGSPPLWNRRIGDEYSAVVEFSNLRSKDSTDAISDLNVAMLNNMMNSRWYTTSDYHHPSSCRADFRALVDDVKLGSTVRCRVLQHAAEMKAVIMWMGSTYRRWSLHSPGDGCTTAAVCGEEILVCIYPKPVGVADLNDWDSLGDDLCPVLSMTRLVEGVSRDYVANDEVAALVKLSLVGQ